MLKLQAAALLAVMITPNAVAACKCLIVYPVCQEVHASDAVFIGVAESVQPKFLDYWKSGPGNFPIEEVDRLKAEGTAASLEKLRGVYLELAGELAQGERLLIEEATTFRDLEDSFNSVSLGGVRTQFRILKNYKKPKDDDDDDNDDKKKDAASVVVWSDAGECGIHFQTGETYLVYADNDEETGRLRTGICYRTRRLADAGADLAFLYRFPETSRLEGFVTSRKEQDRPTYTNKILDPVAGVSVALALPGGARWSTTSDAEGRFWFDGLAGGDYQLSAYEAGYPLRLHELAGPQRVRVPAKGCAMDVIGLP